MDFFIRNATSNDEAFLRDLFFEIRSPEFVASGLIGAPLEQMMAQQYSAMRTHYDRVYEGSKYEIFELDGERIGYQATIELDTLHLIDISITASARGKGIGTARMKELQSRARALGVPMTLTVEKFNPAMRLYERLGFQAYMDSDIYLRMRWTFD